jgi:hypothetical protein
MQLQLIHRPLICLVDRVSLDFSRLALLVSYCSSPGRRQCATAHRSQCQRGPSSLLMDTGMTELSWLLSAPPSQCWSEHRLYTRGGEHTETAEGLGVRRGEQPRGAQGHAFKSSCSISKGKLRDGERINLKLHRNFCICQLPSCTSSTSVFQERTVFISEVYFPHGFFCHFTLTRKMNWFKLNILTWKP